MSITYQCERCGKWHTVREGKVGTNARCNDCGHEMIVPNTPDLFDDAIDGPAGGAAPPRSRNGSTAAQAPSMQAQAPSRRPSPAPAGGRATGQGEGESSGKFWGGGLGLFLLILVVRLAIRGGPMLNRGRQARPNQQILGPQVQAPVVDLSRPIALPKRFPDLGQPDQIEPGVFFHEIKLRPESFPEQPGHKGTLWLYLPADRAKIEPKSLPCVLIAPAGSKGMTGMKLEDGQRPEHLPYVKAGFAVLAFSLDGEDPAQARAQVRGPQQGRRAVGGIAMPIFPDFLRARAGLVNGRIALEFLKARVPQVDQGRLYVAGYDTAGTFALLFAEHEHELKGCVAYAPPIDLVDRFRNDRQALAFEMTGFARYIKIFSPKEGEDKLSCPVFLFHSRADGSIPVEQTIDCAERLRSLGKTVTLDVVDEGDHVRSMRDQGLPKGVEWLKARDGEVRARK
jgi:dienelactone hydrolase/DNA-directed RNA polymerase subunit RPC12/RpoP